MNEILFSDEALEDLNEIRTHISLNSPQGAKKVIQKIMSCINNISIYPHIGHFRIDLTTLDVIFFSVYNYNIIYNVGERAVLIYRILHGIRDINALLGEEKEEYFLDKKLKYYSH